MPCCGNDVNTVESVEVTTLNESLYRHFTITLGVTGPVYLKLSTQCNGVTERFCLKSEEPALVHEIDTCELRIDSLYNYSVTTSKCSKCPVTGSFRTVPNDEDDPVRKLLLPKYYEAISPKGVVQSSFNDFRYLVFLNVTDESQIQAIIDARGLGKSGPLGPRGFTPARFTGEFAGVPSAGEWNFIIILRNGEHWISEGNIYGMSDMFEVAVAMGTDGGGVAPPFKIAPGVTLMARDVDVAPLDSFNGGSYAQEALITSTMSTDGTTRTLTMTANSVGITGPNTGTDATVTIEHPDTRLPDTSYDILLDDDRPFLKSSSEPMLRFIKGNNKFRNILNSTDDNITVTVPSQIVVAGVTVDLPTTVVEKLPIIHVQTSDVNEFVNLGTPRFFQ